MPGSPMWGHMNRAGARHVGEPVTAATGLDRKACLYGATMMAKHMPAFAAAMGAFVAVLRPPATIVLVHPDDPAGAALTYEIPALMLPAPGEAAPARQAGFDEVVA